MGPNEGPRRAALVGDPNFPQTDGRAHHVAPIVYGVGMGLARLAPYAMRAGRALQGLFGSRKLVKDVGTKLAVGKNTAPFTPVKDVFNPNKVGKYFLGSPEGRFITGQGGKLSGLAKRAIASGVKSPLLAGSAIYASDVLPGGEPLLNLDILGNRNILGQKYDPKTNKRIKGTGISSMWEDEVDTLTTSTDTTPLTDAEKAAITKSKKAQAEAAKLAQENFAKAQKEKRIQGYREIMDIKGMNKDAAYDSLIAASQAVLGEGDFKGSLKDGSLINKVISSTSKAFDKPAKTKDAINSLILKGEIEKDIATAKPGTQYKAASDYASMQGVSIDQAYKDLGFSKVNNIATNLTAVNKSLGQTSTSSETLDQAIRLSQDGVIPKILADDTKMLELEKDPNFKDTITLFQETVRENKLGPGVYIIGTEAFQIDEEGNQSQLY